MTRGLQPLPNGQGFRALTAFGALELRPSRRDWRRRAAYWQAWGLDRRPIGPWRPTPELALASALHRLRMAPRP